MAPGPLPTGTVTFLFTDIEGSTKLWEANPATMGEALAFHDRVLRDAIESQGGCVFKTVGDAFCAAFHTAPAAVCAALDAQAKIAEAAGFGEIPLSVRMALHTGAVESRDNDYFGQPLNRVARLLATGHGGQVLISGVAQGLALDSLPAGVSLRPLGEHRLKDLGRPESIFQLIHPGLRAEFPPLRSLASMPNNLPQQVTSFVGREKEIGEVKALLEGTRLLTLTGSGGCGKTRLSLQVAADLLDGSGDGAWLVELAGLSDPSLVAQMVSSIFGLKEQPGKPLVMTLCDYLTDKRLLLLLDNCEHLLPACAQLAESVLRACPRVVILASSREGLGIAGEQTYRVPSLSLPEPGGTETPESLSHYEAVRLFIDRALLHRKDFAATNQNAPALASVCQRLGGIPLAIELAAARLRSMTVEEVNDRLDQRFRLLTGGSRTALPRQQTLRSLIDWSYDLLTEDEKALLARLSVFAGSWTMEAAEAVCAEYEGEGFEILDLLTSLVDKSLVSTEERGGATRYRLLETVREYAGGRLVESHTRGRSRDRHLEYFAEFASRAESGLVGPEQKAWLERVATDFDNLRAAIDWSTEGEGSSENGATLAGALGQFWVVRGGLAEGRSWISNLLGNDKSSELSPTVRSQALHTAGSLAWHQGDYASARSGYEQSLEIRREQGDLRGLTASLVGLGYVAFRQGDYSVAQSLFDEGLGISRDLEEPRAIGLAMNALGLLEWTLGDLATAQSHYEECLVAWRKLGNLHGIATALNNLGILAADAGDYASARALHEESMAIRLELGDRAGLGFSFGNLATIACQEGDFSAAQALYAKTLEITRELGDRRGIAKSTDNVGYAMFKGGDPVGARPLIEEGLAMSRELGDRQGIAHSLGNLGYLTLELGDGDSSGRFFDEALRMLRELGERPAIVETLEGCALLASHLERHDRAARIWGGAARLRGELGVPHPVSELPSYEAQTAAARAAFDEDDVFDAEWAEGRAMTMEQLIDLALTGTSDTPISAD